MDDFKDFVAGLIIPLFMGLYGGLASYCFHEQKGLKPLVSGLVISSFSGIVVHLLLVDSSMPPTVQSALVGTSGFGGVVIINALVSLILKNIARMGK